MSSRDLSADIVLDILERVGATDTAAALRAATGASTSALRCPRGAAANPDDDPILVQLVTSALSMKGFRAAKRDAEGAGAEAELRATSERARAEEAAVAQRKAAETAAAAQREAAEAVAAQCEAAEAVAVQRKAAEAAAAQRKAVEAAAAACAAAAQRAATEAAAAAAQLDAAEEAKAAVEHAHVSAAADAEADSALLDIDDVIDAGTLARSLDRSSAVGSQRPAIAAWSSDNGGAASSISGSSLVVNGDVTDAWGATSSRVVPHSSVPPSSAWGSATTTGRALSDVYLEDVFDASDNGDDSSVNPRAAITSSAKERAPTQAPHAPHSSGSSSTASTAAVLNFFDNPVVRDAVALSSEHSAGEGKGSIPSALSSAERVRLSSVLVGDDAPNVSAGGGLPLSWLTQPLFFSAREGLRYGLVQPRGGPCGPLAAVNAEVIKRLLFGCAPLAADPPTDAAALLAAAAADWPPPSTDALQTGGGVRAMPFDAPVEALFCALLGAAVDILWRARASCSATVKLVVPFGSAHGGGGCSLDKTAVLELASRRDLSHALCARAASFFGQNAGGLALIVFSALLTRGLDGIAADADAPTPPMLHASGRAVSHCVDGSVDAGGVILRGAAERADVGFLSVHAALGLQDVGTHLRCPRAPVWVVYGESHYSVLFAAPEGSAWPPPPPPRRTFGVRSRKPPFSPAPERCRGNALAGGSDDGAAAFDVVYWDGLAKQEHMARLTVEGAAAGGAPALASGSRAHARGRLDAEKSALELWVMSKWGFGATVAWNYTEPWEPMSILDG